MYIMYFTFDSSVTHTDGDISSVDSECVTDYLEVSVYLYLLMKV